VTESFSRMTQLDWVICFYLISSLAMTYFCINIIYLYECPANPVPMHYVMMIM